MAQDDILLPGETLADIYGENAVAPINAGLAVRLAESELNMHIATAHKFPRSVSKAAARIQSLATLNGPTAAKCRYVVPRDGKQMTGPTIRFAEIVASQWGNCHTGSRIVDVDREAMVVIAEGVFWDLETGTKRVTQVRRPISNKQGKLYSNDMIMVTGNAAASIALREAILRGVPFPIWGDAYDAAVKVIEGDAKTLAQTRAKAIETFEERYAVTPKMIFQYFEVGGIEDLGLEQVGLMRSMIEGVVSGEVPITEYFPEAAPKPKAVQQKAAPAQQKTPPAQQEAPAARNGKAAPAQQKAAPAQQEAQETPHDADGVVLETKAKAEAKTESSEPAEDFEALAQKILANAFDGGVPAARAHHAEDIARIEAQAPETFTRLQQELAAYESADNGHG